MIINEQNINSLISLAEEAGKIIMHYYRSDFEIIVKSDNSPATTADLKANELIVRELEKITSDIEIVSEENLKSQIQVKNNTFWLVDPLDGTRSFINGDHNFAVSIGLVHNSEPVFGVICIPVTKLVYFTKENRAYKKYENGLIEEISSAYRASEGLDVVTSGSRLSQKKVDGFLTQFKVRNHYFISSAVKFCMIAEGKANIYPCCSKTMAWDTAAGHAILKAAGGEITVFGQNELLSYNKCNLANPHFLASGLKLKI